MTKYDKIRYGHLASAAVVMVLLVHNSWCSMHRWLVTDLFIGVTVPLCIWMAARNP